MSRPWKLRRWYYNKVNKSLVQLVNELGVKAVGISGKDGGLLKCEKKLSKGQDIGFVGEITEGKSEDHLRSSGERFSSDHLSDRL